MYLSRLEAGTDAEINNDKVIVMKKAVKIIGTFFILLLLIFSSIPGVQAISSQPPGSSDQAVSPEAPEPGAKVSALLFLQVGAKVHRQQTPSAADELSMMRQMGMRTDNLDMQRVFIHLAQEPTPSQIDELKVMGITPYPDSWIPPIGDYPTGFIVADIPIDKLGELAVKDYVVQLDTAEQMLEPQNDLAAIKVNADDVWTSGYDGTGVRIVVVDSGLDTNHPDIPAPVASKDYSNWPVLDDTIANTVSGHGTHVAGSALGRGTRSAGATNQYKGMAPGADLVFLKIGNDTTGGASLDAMTNAIKAAVDIYNADIITMSYGGWGYYHDGTRQTAQAVDYAFSQGAVVFISAGNEANDDQHYSGTVNANSTSGFIQVNVTDSSGFNAALGFNLVWYDGLGSSNDLTLEYYGSGQTLLTSVWAGTQEESSKGTEHELSGYGPDAGWYYYLPAGDLTYYLKITNNSSNSQFFHIYFDGIAGGGASVKFQNPDPFYTLSSPSDAENAIAVGSYTTRKNWTDYQGTTYSFINPAETVDTISAFSSRGPRVDSGAPQKPNIVAPGSAIISARDQDVYLWPGGANAYFIDNDGLNLDGSGPADYYVMRGTSMASPIAAGAAALLLEAKPELKGNPATVRNLLQSTATSVVANDNIDGYGLLNIQSALAASAAEVSSVSPAADAVDVAVDTVITATFSGEMNASTITTSSFTLDSVSGSVSYDSVTYTATFTPGASLSYSTTYTATLSTAITDAAGNPLASAYSWSFTTASAPPGAVTVSIDAPATAAADSDFTANVNISEVTNFDAGNYDVSFDASVLRLDNVTSGLIGSTTIPVDIYNEISSGTYRIIQNVPGLSGVSGSGYLAVLHFHVIGAEGDSSTISLSNGILANNLAEEITATWVGDSVDVTSVLPGDANGDGNVNALDITKVERIIAGLDAQTPGADANQDGSVNALDITKIERIIAGLD